MKKQILWVAIGLIVAALAPAVAVAGGETGACMAVLQEFDPSSAPEGFEEAAYICADGFSEGDCNLFCGENAAPEGGLFLVDCVWASDLTCEDLTEDTGEPWEGSCVLSDQNPPPFGGLCVLISENLPSWDSEEICEFAKLDGNWEEGGVCGAPVPTMPKTGQAALIIVLMFGALVILNFSGIFRSA